MNDAPDAFAAAANSSNRASRTDDRKEWAKQRKFCNPEFAVTVDGLSLIRQMITGFVAVLIFVIEASKGEETGFNPYRLGTDPTQMWAPTAVFSLTLILNVFIFIFFLVGIDKGLGFFEEHPKIVKRVKSAVPKVFGLFQLWSLLVVSTQGASPGVVLGVLFGFVSCLCHLFPAKWMPLCCIDVTQGTKDEDTNSADNYNYDLTEEA